MMVREIFGPFYGDDEKLIYPAMQPDSEVMAGEFGNDQVPKDHMSSPLPPEASSDSLNDDNTSELNITEISSLTCI